jgi:hypothetical protein
MTEDTNTPCGSGVSQALQYHVKDIRNGESYGAPGTLEEAQRLAVDTAAERGVPRASMDWKSVHAVGGSRWILGYKSEYRQPEYTGIEIHLELVSV